MDSASMVPTSRELNFSISKLFVYRRENLANVPAE
jgi:hypothetical protein